MSVEREHKHWNNCGRKGEMSAKKFCIFEHGEKEDRKQ